MARARDQAAFCDDLSLAITLSLSLSLSLSLVVIIAIIYALCAFRHPWLVVWGSPWALCASALQVHSDRGRKTVV